MMFLGTTRKTQRKIIEEKESLNSDDGIPNMKSCLTKNNSQKINPKYIKFGKSNQNSSTNTLRAKGNQFRYNKETEKMVRKCIFISNL